MSERPSKRARYQGPAELPAADRAAADRAAADRAAAVKAAFCALEHAKAQRAAAKARLEAPADGAAYTKQLGRDAGASLASSAETYASHYGKLAAPDGATLGAMLKAATQRVAAAQEAADDACRARPRKFQDFAATHQGVVAEHVGALLATNGVARLMRTAHDLHDAGTLTFKLWDGCGKRMGDARGALKAKYATARAPAQAKLDAALAAHGPEPPRHPPVDVALVGGAGVGVGGGGVAGQADREQARSTWRERRDEIRAAYLAEVRPKLKAVDDTQRAPDLPDLPDGLALHHLVPWAPGRPPVSCVAEVHLPKQADAGGKSLRCWRVAPGNLCIIGGYGNPAASSVPSWDWKADQWVDGRVPALPEGEVKDAAVAWLQGKLYLIGGSDPRVRYGETGKKQCWCWDPARSGTWTRVADLAVARHDHEAVALGRHLYVFGGDEEDDFALELGIEENPRNFPIERYNPEADTWESVVDMSVVRDYAAFAVLGGKIYAVGGHDGDMWLQSCERYDPATDAWEPVANMATVRSTACVAALDGKLWVAGGYNVEVFDPVNNTWEPKPELTMTRTSIAVLDGEVYGFCSARQDNPLAYNPTGFGTVAAAGDVTSVEKFDERTNSWVIVPGMTLSNVRPGLSNWRACCGGQGLGGVPQPSVTVTERSPTPPSGSGYGGARCPTAGHAMVRTAELAGPYARGGWLCDACGTGGRGARWHCARCSDDYCDACE